MCVLYYISLRYTILIFVHIVLNIFYVIHRPIVKLLYGPIIRQSIFYVVYYIVHYIFIIKGIFLYIISLNNIILWTFIYTTLNKLK